MTDKDRAELADIAAAAEDIALRRRRLMGRLRQRAYRIGHGGNGLA